MPPAAFVEVPPVLSTFDVPVSVVLLDVFALAVSESSVLPESELHAHANAVQGNDSTETQAPTRCPRSAIPMELA